MSNLKYEVTLRPLGDAVIEATGGTDGRVIMGPKGTPNSFTPVELLLAAIGGCTGIDLNTVGKLADTDVSEFELRVRGIKPLDGKQLSQISVEVSIPGLDTDTVAALAAEASQLCTVAITVANGAPVENIAVAS